MAPNLLSVSLVNPVMDGNDPTELPINLPDSVWATQSFPLPTVDGDALDGCNGSKGAVPHLLACQTVLGYLTSKHPACGAGTLDMYPFHAAQLAKVGGGWASDCSDAMAEAFNDGGSANTRLTRIAHANNCLTCIRVSLASRPSYDHLCRWLRAFNLLI